MTLRAVDLQVLVPKMTDVSRHQHNQQQAGQTQQQLAAQQAQQAAVRRQNSVQASSQSENPKVGDREKQKGQPEGRNRQRENDRGNAGDEQSPQDPVRGKHFDFKV